MLLSLYSAMMDYTSSTPQTITSLTELKPGDHIQVPATKYHLGLKSYSLSPDSGPEKCDGKVITHHLLVVEAIYESSVKVIHKVIDGIKEEKKRYRPSDVTVLEYKSVYMGQAAIARARKKKEEGEKYHFGWSNCEHFVTEVRTGKKKSIQLRGAVGGGTGGGTMGVTAGASTGAVVGGVIGGLEDWLVHLCSQGWEPAWEQGLALPSEELVQELF